MKLLRTLLLLLGAVLLGVLLWRLGPAEVFALVGRVGWYFIPALALYTLHHVFRAFALRACVPRPDLLGYGDALAVFLAAVRGTMRAVNSGIVGPSVA